MKETHNSIPEKYQFLNGSTLKIIAMFTMLLDHIGAAVLCYLPGCTAKSQIPLWQGCPIMLYDFYRILRNTGRIAFPIYCFLLVEGFFHTTSKKKYAFRLFIFALISELPFNLAFLNAPFSFQMQNVFWTLLFGLLCMTALEKQKQTACSLGSSPNIQISNNLFIILFFVGLATLLKTDYYGIGIILIIIFYYYHNNRKMACIIGYLSFLWEPFCFPAFLCFPFYNGKKGLSVKYLFYAFYPLHLLFLYLLRLHLIR